jgi:hypothetical protein
MDQMRFGRGTLQCAVGAPPQPSTIARTFIIVMSSDQGMHRVGGEKLPHGATDVRSRRQSASRVRNRHFTFNDFSRDEPRGEPPMRKAILLLCAAVCFAPAVFAQTLLQADREKGKKYL